MKNMEPFWMTLQSFRDDTFIVQMLIIVAYLGILFLIAKREGARTDAIVKVILSSIFIFNGIACFLMYFSELPMAKFFAGPLYLAIGYLFLIDIMARRIPFTFNVSPLRRFLAFIFVILAFLFPVFGMLSGHGMIALPGVDVYKRQTFTQLGDGSRPSRTKGDEYAGTYGVSPFSGGGARGTLRRHETVRFTGASASCGSGTIASR